MEPAWMEQLAVFNTDILEKKNWAPAKPMFSLEPHQWAICRLPLEIQEKLLFGYFILRRMLAGEWLYPWPWKVLCLRLCNLNRRLLCHQDVLAKDSSSCVSWSQCTVEPRLHLSPVSSPQLQQVTLLWRQVAESYQVLHVCYWQETRKQSFDILFHRWETQNSEKWKDLPKAILLILGWPHSQASPFSQSHTTPLVLTNFKNVHGLAVQKTIETNVYLKCPECDVAVTVRLSQALKRN